MTGEIQRPTMQRFSKDLHQFLVRYCVEPPLEDRLSMAEFIGTLMIEIQRAIAFADRCWEEKQKREGDSP